MIVSECCHRDIVVSTYVDYPLGGSTWGITYKVDICIGCGKEADPIELEEEEE